MSIIVEKHNPLWDSEFKKARGFYKDLLSDLDIEIEHVGSTSVKDLLAKPILDIDIIVKNNDDNLRVIKLLESVGYRHLGNLGIEGREAFRYDLDNPHITWMKHNLYVCLEGCENLRNHLFLRKHLRSNPDAIIAYSNLKRELASIYPDDIDSYVDGKTDLITTF